MYDTLSYTYRGTVRQRTGKFLLDSRRRMWYHICKPRGCERISHWKVKKFFKNLKMPLDKVVVLWYNNSVRKERLWLIANKSLQLKLIDSRGRALTTETRSPNTETLSFTVMTSYGLSITTEYVYQVP